MLKELLAGLSHPGAPHTVALSRRETLRRVVKGQMSLARYGDGEMLFAFKQRGVHFQSWDRRLAERLQTVLLEPPPGVLPCFNHHFSAHPEVPWIVAYERYPKNFGGFRTLKSADDIGILKRAKEQKVYAAYWRTVARKTHAPEVGDAAVFFLGTYVEEYQSGEIEAVLDDYRALFRGRKILFVAPETPHGGPSFRDQVPSLKRIGMLDCDFIEIPSRNVAAHESEILREIRARRNFDDVFIQAGPFATVMASDLTGSIPGRAIDAGSLNTQIRFLV